MNPPGFHSPDGQAADCPRVHDHNHTDGRRVAPAAALADVHARVWTRVWTGARSDPPEGGRVPLLCRFSDFFSPLWTERRCAACSGVFRIAGQGSPATDTAGEQSGPLAASPLSRPLFCPDCAVRLPRSRTGFCPACGELAAWPELPLALCGRCLTAPPPWRGLVFHGPHEGLLRHMLLALKFQNQPHKAHALGSLLAGHPGLAALRADVLVPVPLHKKRLVKRGYNQALELCRPLAARLALPLVPDLLQRVRPTAPQTGRSRADRKDNTRSAFLSHSGVRGGHVLLVDDTVTTGATLWAAATALLEAGASSVSVAAVSRMRLCRRAPF